MNNPGRRLPRFVGAGLFILITGCASSHKMLTRNSNKTDSVSHASSMDITHTQSIISENADTTILISPDTATLKIFVPNILADEDTSSTAQELQTDHLKITIITKPIFSSGKKIGINISAQAIKKVDSLKVKVNKTTVTNVETQTKTKSDITLKKSSSQTDKNVKRKGFNFISTVIIWLIIFALLIIGYFWLKKQYKL